MKVSNEAKLNPSSVFKSPNEILECKELSRRSKIEILKSWAYDERGKQVAEEENMRSLYKEGSDLFAEIENALITLGYESSKENFPHTKQV